MSGPANQGNAATNNQGIASREAFRARQSRPIAAPPWNKPLVPVCFALILGILFDTVIAPNIRLPSAAQFWNCPLGFYALLGAFGALLWGILFRLGRLHAAGFSLWFSIILLGAALHYRHAHLFQIDEIGCYALRDDRPLGASEVDRAAGHPREPLDIVEDHAAAPICLEAVITALPELIPSRELGKPSSPSRWGNQPNTILRARVQCVRDGTVWRSASGRIYVYVTGMTPGLLPGDQIRLTGHIALPREPANPGEFDLRGHRRADRVLAEVYGTFAEGVHVVRRGAAWDPRRCLALVRVAAAEALDRHISPPQAALAKALLLGIRREVDDAFEEQLLRTGTIHLLAISGLHVGIFAGVVVFALRWLPVRPRVRFSTALLAVAAYLAVSGGQPPTVRAAIVLGTYFLV